MKQKKIDIKNLKYSILVSLSGIPDNISYSETDYKDVKNACSEMGLNIDETEPGESEYDYLATESGEPEDGSFWDEWKDNVCDLTASGIINFDQLEELCHSIGCFPEDCETMGTLGGPLSFGIVRDISFRCESSIIIESIRVTPFEEEKEPSNEKQLDLYPPTEEEIERSNNIKWNEVKDAVLLKLGV